MARILVTGAGGFVGRSLCPGLAARGHQVVAGLRRGPAPDRPPIAGAEPCIIGDITPERDWSREFDGIEVVVHLAQRAHRRAAPAILAGEPVAAAALARAAARAGVRRLVYFSSIKAMGEATQPGRPFRAGDIARPADANGRAKLATERALAATAAQTGIELAILRPPLVYGPGAAGNFRALVRLAASGLPLPFAALDNRRSLIGLDNLVDLAASAAVHPAAAGRILLAADDEDLSTARLICLLARGQGRTARLFGVPAAAFAVLRSLPGIGPPVSRLTLSLQVDIGATRAALGWSPPVAVEAGLLAAARALSASRRER